MNWKLLKALVESHAVSGREEGVRGLIRKELTAVGCKLSGDAMGNVIGFRKGKGKAKVMLAGHMDEIGFVVTHVDKEGFVRFQPCGGFDPRTLMSQRVYVHTNRGALLGVMGAKPIHVLTEDEIKKSLKVTDYFVDLGLPGKEVGRRVEIGDPITMARGMEEMGNCITAKSLDNRIGVWLMIEALRKLKSHDVDIYAVATTQEEVGIRGALAAARDVHPDVGIALDVTIACDTPGADAKDHVTNLGEGTAIKIMDGASISNPKLVQELRALARKRKIKFQMEILPRGGTDAGAMRQVTGHCAVGAISVPLRYVHSTVETVHKDDLKASVDLLTAYLQTTTGKGYELGAGR